MREAEIRRAHRLARKEEIEAAGAAREPLTDWRHTTHARLWLDLPAEADVDDLHAIHSDPTRGGTSRSAGTPREPSRRRW